jgi:hypothetical protein
MQRTLMRLVVSLAALASTLVVFNLPAAAGGGCTECLPNCPPGSRFGEGACEEACGIESAEWECLGGSGACNPGDILLHCWA